MSTDSIIGNLVLVYLGTYMYYILCHAIFTKHTRILGASSLLS